MSGHPTVVSTPVGVLVLVAVVVWCLFLPPWRGYFVGRDHSPEIPEYRKAELRLEREEVARRHELFREQLHAQEEHRAMLRAPVRDYLPDSAVASAVFQVTRIHYLGNYHEVWRYDHGRVSHHDGWPGRWITTYSAPGFDMTAEETGALLDLLNVIVRDGLAAQGDEEYRGMIDGGESKYEFSFVGLDGQFRLINTSPSHLEHFLAKTCELAELSRSLHPWKKDPE